MKRILLVSVILAAMLLSACGTAITPTPTQTPAPTPAPTVTVTATPKPTPPTSTPTPQINMEAAKKNEQFIVRFDYTIASSAGNAMEGMNFEIYRTFTNRCSIDYPSNTVTFHNPNGTDSPVDIDQLMEGAKSAKPVVFWPTEALLFVQGNKGEYYWNRQRVWPLPPNDNKPPFGTIVSLPNNPSFITGAGVYHIPGQLALDIAKLQLELDSRYQRELTNARERAKLGQPVTEPNRNKFIVTREQERLIAKKYLILKAILYSREQ